MQGRATKTKVRNMVQKKRTCLKCFRPFDSSGPWNRLCPGCKIGNRELLKYDDCL